MKSRIFRAAVTALLAAAIAGSTARILLLGLGLSCPSAYAWLPVAVVALILGFGTLNRVTGAAAFGLLIALGMAFLLPRRATLDSLAQWIRSLTAPGVEIDATLTARASALVCPVVSALLAACMFAFLWASGGTSFAVLVFFASVMVGYSLAPELSFRLMLPGLTGCVAAFALSGRVARDAGAWRALVAAALVVALAFAFVPGDRVTFEPFAHAAAKARALFEDYFRFTEERIPFTITAEGYNMAVMEEDDIVSRLGGPATPHTDPILEVTASSRVLLRGAIKRTYTGQNWIDPDAKSRYLYYDVLRRDIRSDVFGMRAFEAFDPVDVTVTFLDQGTSALFVPSRLKSFSMDLSAAVYFNSVGELFLSRQTEAGDTYTLKGYVCRGEALREAVLARADDRDEGYSDAVETCLQLPSGIEDGVYQLTYSLTEGLDNPYDKALAIENWLKANCVYTLQPELPDVRRDFVSEFVLTTRRGYCSYFASAMTIMCRIAGIPARYVEGFAANASQTPVTLTGEDAHAWTEIYFNGIGWVSFDASNGGTGESDAATNPANEPPSGGESSADSVSEGDQSDGTSAADGMPTPTPEPPQGDETQGQNDEGNQSEELQSGSAALETPAPEPPTVTPPPRADDDPPSNDRHDRWWLPLLLLALLALALFIGIRLVRTDPLRLSANAKNPEEATAILYRAMLTLFRQTGEAPMREETPGQFARRVAKDDGSFARFADSVAASAYGRASADAETVRLGRAAYTALSDQLTVWQRLRYFRTRVTRGLGRFDQIP